MDICALIISLLALSFYQFIRDSLWQKKKATLDAYNELQKEVFSDLTTYSSPLPKIVRGDNEWDKFTIFLANLEQFSVGINTGIYSIKTLNDIGGNYYIYEFKKLKPIIWEKRNNPKVPGEHYKEYEKTVRHLNEYQGAKKHIKRIILLLKWQFKN